ncbi:Methyltransferase domain-containing protein [Apiospora arundinis]
MQSDLVHLERVAPYLRRPKDLLAKILANLRPGGWVEIEDMQTQFFSDDARVPPENGCAYAAQVFNKSQKEKFGFDLDTAWNARGAERSRWIGYLLQSALRQVMEPLSLRPLQALGLSQSDISAIVHDFERDVSDTSLHMWMPMTITIGQKAPATT